MTAITMKQAGEAKLMHVSPNIPDPQRHPKAKFKGLHDWVLGLPLDERWDYVALILHRSRDSTPEAHLWTAFLDTADVAMAYDCASKMQRWHFDQVVRWQGEPDGPSYPGEPGLDSSVAATSLADDSDGLCYLDLLVVSARDKARAILGINPVGPAVAGYLLNNPTLWSPESFMFTTGKVVKATGATPYLQTHVAKADFGARVANILPLLVSGIRVGSDGQKQLLGMAGEVMAPATKVRTAFDDPSDGSRITMSLPIFLNLNTKVTSIKWSVFSTPLFVAMLGPYESVRLESAEFLVRVDPGVRNVAFCAITSVSAPLLAGNDWHLAPVTAQISGTDGGCVSAGFSLPQPNQFNKEIRAGFFGNGPPAFHFGYAGVAETQMDVFGMIKVSVAGLGLMNRVNIASNSGKAMRAFTTSIQRSLSYSVDTIAGLPPGVGNEEEESDDSDEEEEQTPVVHRSSPPRNRA